MIDDAQDDDPQQVEPPPVRRSADRARTQAALAYSVPLYGRMSLQVLAMVTALSAGSLTVFMGLILTARTLTPGVPYADVPAALMAMGGATSLACLATASAYFAQQAYLLEARPRPRALSRPSVEARARRWRVVGGTLHVMTIVMTTSAYVAFAISGLVVVHFCVAAIPALSRAQTL